MCAEKGGLRRNNAQPRRHDLQKMTQISLRAATNCTLFREAKSVLLKKIGWQNVAKCDTFRRSHTIHSVWSVFVPLLCSHVSLTRKLSMLTARASRTSASIVSSSRSIRSIFSRIWRSQREVKTQASHAVWFLEKSFHSYFLYSDFFSSQQKSIPQGSQRFLSVKFQTFSRPFPDYLQLFPDPVKSKSFALVTLSPSAHSKLEPSVAQTRWRPEVVLPRRLTTQLRKTMWRCQAVEQRTAPWETPLCHWLSACAFCRPCDSLPRLLPCSKRQSRHHTPYSERGHFSQGQAKAKTWTGRQKATALKTCTFPFRVRRAAAIRETQRNTSPNWPQVRKSETQSKSFRPPSL